VKGDGSRSGKTARSGIQAREGMLRAQQVRASAVPLVEKLAQTRGPLFVVHVSELVSLLRTVGLEVDAERVAQAFVAGPEDSVSGAWEVRSDGAYYRFVRRRRARDVG
jgi:hypothetical protein